jgi:hypothetical protein
LSVVVELLLSAVHGPLADLRWDGAPKAKIGGYGAVARRHRRRWTKVLEFARVTNYSNLA